MVKRPYKIQCTFYCHRIAKNIAPLSVYVGPPPLGSKWLQRTKLSDGVVCPKKVGKMAFIGCIEFQWTKFAWKLLIELKRYRSKVKVFWHAWAVDFQMVKLKICLAPKYLCMVGLCSKVSVQLDLRKSFLESVSFHGEMFFWLIFD